MRKADFLTAGEAWEAVITDYEAKQRGTLHDDEGA